MNHKKKTLILIGLFAILMIGASILYNTLSANYTLDSLIVENNNSNITDNESDNHTSTTDSNDTDESSSTTDSNDTDQHTSTTDSNDTDQHTSTADSNKADETSSESENKLTKAPNFTVYDLAGNKVNLTDFFGKPIIVNFWASWCGPCQMEMPDFDAAFTTYKNEIEFLMVNMTDGSRETVEKASSFIAEKGYTFPVYYDTEYNAAITYSVSSLPTTYFIDAEGNLIAHARGAINANTLQRGIDMIYNQGGQ